MTENPYLVGLRLAGKKVVVVGGGTVAQRRLPLLIASGADVHVIAPSVTPAVEAMDQITLSVRDYRDGDLDGAWYAIAATDDARVNVRTLAFQVCYVSAAAVAARFGAAALAAHQVVLQLWGLLALVLDSLAIAAQSLVGAALGAGDAGHAKAVAWRVTAFSLLAAGILAAALGLGSSVLPGLFTDDRSVLAAIGVPWWFMVVQLPFAGIVFAVDGVLLGAGDAAFMRTATVASALVGFLPLVWLSLAYGWGLAGIWSGLGTFIVLRLIFVGWRAYSGRWAVTGAA